MSMVHVLAVITAKPGKRAEILEAFNNNVPAVHAEQGCIEYGAAVDADGVGPFQTKMGEETFVVIEKWESLDALMAHQQFVAIAVYTGHERFCGRDIIRVGGDLRQRRHSSSSSRCRICPASRS